MLAIVYLNIVYLDTVYLDSDHLDINVQVCEHLSHGTSKLIQQLRHEIVV